MKRALRILLLAIAVILLLNILLVAILSNKSVQNRLCSYGEDWLKEKTGTELSIGYVGFDFLRGLSLENLYVEDLKSDTLLYAGSVKADMSLRALLDLNYLKIKRVELDDFVVHIDKSSDSTDFNYQFLLDAFASEEKSADEPSKPFGLKIDAIYLSNGRATYDVEDVPQTDGFFNASHIDCSDLRMEAAFAMSPAGELNVEVEHLSFREQSGLRIEDMASDVCLKDNQLSLPSLTLSLPKSVVALRGDYALDNGQYNLNLHADSLSLADLRCFVPQLSSLTDSMSLSLAASGVFPSVDVKDLSINYPSLLRLEAPRVKMDDCMAWEETGYDLWVKELCVTKMGADRILKVMGSEQGKQWADYLPLTTNFTYKGSLPSGKVMAELAVPFGSLKVDGDLRYRHTENYLGCNLSAQLNDVALDSILKSDDFKKVTMNSDIQVEWRMEQMPDVRFSGFLPQFSYRGYAYDTLRLVAHYFSSDSISSRVDIGDPNLRGVVWLEGVGLTGEQPRLLAKAQLDDFSPKATHLVDSLGDMRVATRLSAELTDFNQLLGKVTVDSLRVSGDSAGIHWQEPLLLTHRQMVDGTRRLSLSSPAVDAEMAGVYEFVDLYPAVIKTLQPYWPDVLDQMEVGDLSIADSFDFSVKVKRVEEWAQLFGKSIALPMGASLNGNISVPERAMRLKLELPSLSWENRKVSDISLRLSADGTKVKLSANVVADTSASGATEMMRVRLNSVVTHNQMEGVAYANTFPDPTFIKGSLPFVVYSTVDSAGKVNMNLTTQAADWTLVGYQFGTSPAEIHQMGKKIFVKNIGISLDDNVLLSVDGVASDLLSDTMNVRFDRVNLEPIVSALARKHVPLQCSLDGDLYGYALMGEAMRFKTNNLRFDSIVYEGVHWGDLAVDMRWNNERKGVLSKMVLTNEGRRTALIQGVVKPVDQTLKMVMTLDSLPVDRFIPFSSDFVSELRGNVGANILAEGKFDNVALEGRLFFQDLHARINYTGVGYTISDTIKFEKNRVRVDHFRLRDDNGRLLTLKGNVSHEDFKKFNYDLMVNMDNFLLLNNPKAKSNTVSGTFYANAKNLTVQGTDTHVKVRGEFSNGDKTTLNIILPETVTEVQNYDNIVYVKPAGYEVADTLAENLEMPLDIDADISVRLTDEATFYVNVADGAMVNGNGNLRVTYKEETVSIYDRYTVNSGYVKIKLSEIPAKKFTIQEGAYVQFNGDPMKLQFDATACYDVTADLATLSKNFTGMGLGSTRQPVRCSAKASGSLSEMNLSYDITLPKAADNVTQHMNSIITTDDIRIREFAYLIGLGMFYAPDGQTQGDEMLTSLASSSLSAALNNALSSVLKDKVTIGTGFSTSDEDFSDVEMNLSVSTKLLNDRLLLSTNLGYQKQASGEENEASFLGDFDAEYLLGKKKVLRIKAYNHTNNDYYRNSNNTQGVGVVFVKESKTLRGLLPFGKDEHGTNLLAPRDSVRTERRERDAKK